MILELVIKLKIAELNILGQLSREKIPIYINNAEVLVMARAKGLELRRGFRQNSLNILQREYQL